MLKLGHFSYLGIAGIICLLCSESVQAQGKEKLVQIHLNREYTVPKEGTKAEVPITQIPQISDIQRPHTSVKDWLTQLQNQVILVTGVSLNTRENSLEVTLETSSSDHLQTVVKSEGNNFIVDIPNAQLKLSSGELFRQEKPSAGITDVVVTNHDANTIRVTVTGETSLPKVELDDSDKGLIFVVAPVTTSTQQPQIPDTPPTQPSAQDDQPIELVVTGTRFEVPIQDAPQSIQVIPRQVLEDRGVVRLDEFTDNVSGIQRLTGGAGPGSSGFIIRGFADDYETLRNGFRTQGGFARDLANIDRVEVLKGPAAILYGSGFQSGTVNTITKKPLEDPLYEVKATFGSYSFYRGEVDFTGPLTQSGSLLYRLNASYQNEGSFRDFGRYAGTFIAPALTWKLGDRTTLNIDYENFTYESVSAGAFRADPRFFNVRRSFYQGEPDLDLETYSANSLTYEFEHRFSDNWQFKQTFNRIWQEISAKRASRRALQADGETLNRRYTVADADVNNLTFRNELFGKFNTGSLRHNLLFGVEYSHLDYPGKSFSTAIDPINIFNPRYGARPTGELSLDYFETYGNDVVGIYVQDLIEVLPNLKIAAGVRFDSSTGSNENLQTNTIINEVSDSQFSPRLGIVYQPSDTTTLYASWSNSFTPQIYGRNSRGGAFKPITSEQLEVGIRQELFDRRLLAGLALYQITRQNVVTDDPNSDDFLDRIQTGEQRSRGIELDISGEISPGWKIITTYAYTDAVVTKDNEIPVGDRLGGVPYNSASLWTTYEIQKGNLQGFGGGFGLVYVGDRANTIPNEFTTPSYLRADAVLFYRSDRYDINLNFKNLSNLKYFDTNSYGDSLSVQEPFTVIGSFSYRF
ncbi:TonB-dependent siderophore receptor (plasmid) [Trichormus variabilis ARAD]|uniref:TonB-dependent siderophore receptor n=1 Tax=Trichormus variabilis N2B TaxID=2681315 RepID=A0ABR6SGY1_ANAVA|nr:TonB-dependent siderophore receptor [Trichormus variabilis ARAD]MBC1259169.1 TonB-dependent siderophore receptor [Trichormus variabilis V5]MBC1305650.1 TonB-dependent siderophore receptor [Trichormus variabilis N2B]MBC1314589.1 TonB-dependent siderophore receptor [Trichormus variabilis PNB]MBC1329975.1 TonB-dependent siderophore receptor [Trichormus variabilis 9RC]MBD2383338.1 TonB-dependent siderophore receptor [Trichormus variabilis FACHB-319]QFZ15951.1 TonB-dependent siderophore recepto